MSNTAYFLYVGFKFLSDNLCLLPEEFPVTCTLIGFFCLKKKKVFIPPLFLKDINSGHKILN